LWLCVLHGRVLLRNNVALRTVNGSVCWVWLLLVVQMVLLLGDVSRIAGWGLIRITMPRREFGNVLLLWSDFALCRACGSVGSASRRRRVEGILCRNNVAHGEGSVCDVLLVLVVQAIATVWDERQWGMCPLETRWAWGSVCGGMLRRLVAIIRSVSGAIRRRRVEGILFRNNFALGNRSICDVLLVLLV